MEYVYQIYYFIRRWSAYFGLIKDQNLDEVFYQLLLARNYEEAMKLALQYEYLDIDLVYKCKWRSSGITVQSINLVLAKIQDKLWAINECVQTVPISYEACRTLIEFGLKEANLRLLYQLGDEQATSKVDHKSKPNDPSSRNDLLIKTSQIINAFGGSRRGGQQYSKLNSLPDDIGDEELEGLIDFDNLNDQQKELCLCRQKLIFHEHSLFAYENILGDYRTIQQHFDHVFYDEYRQKCPLNACIDFAHEGDGRAVEVLLNFYTEELKGHLLTILSHFPETLSPYQYRNLLPCLKDASEDAIFEWQAATGQQIKRDEFDWSNRCQANILHLKELKNLHQEYIDQFYKDEQNLTKYSEPYKSKLLTQWYIERALEMESKTSLISNAIQLLRLGSELNIKQLNRIHDDLIEFDGIIYDCCCSSDDIYLSYSEFSKMSHCDRLILITGESLDNCKDKFRFYVLPYIHRREDELKFEGKAKLFKEYFLKLASQREQLCQVLYEDLLDKIECDTFVANWTNNMDDIIDEIGDEIKRIQRDKQSKQLLNMASQTISLGDFNGCYEACKLIIKKQFKNCWPICCQLGMHKDFKNPEAKYKLLAFALTHCANDQTDSDAKMSAKILDYIIELRKRDEKLQFAYLQQNS